MAVGLGLHQVALLPQVGDYGLAGLVAVHAVILAAVYYLCVFVNALDLFQIVAQTHFIVVGVVAGGHLHGAGAEAQLHVVVGHDGELPANQGQDGVLAHQVLVALIVGVDGHTGIAQHSLRPGSGDDELLIRVLNGVAYIPESAGHVLILHLCVGQGGAALGAPVDYTASLVDEALLVQVAEGLPHGAGADLVHGEAAALPVAGDAQALLLLHYSVAVLLLPGPDPLQELLPAQVITAQSLFLAQHFLHLYLGGYARMVHAGQPQSGIALHTLIAGEYILQGRVQGVAHMQLAGDIGWGHDDGEGLFVLVHNAFEVSALHPHIVDFLFHRFGIIGLWKLSHKNILLKK